MVTQMFPTVGLLEKTSGGALTLRILGFVDPDSSPLNSKPSRTVSTYLLDLSLVLRRRIGFQSPEKRDN